MTKIPVMLVGRHQGAEIPGLDIQVQENVTFSLDRDEVEGQIASLIAKARAAGLALVFQNTPTIVTAALVRLTCSIADEWVPISHPDGPRVGLIVSKPGPRLAGVCRSFGIEEAVDVDAVVHAVAFANARAQIQATNHSVTVIVDPVAPWEFSHIEWL